MAEQPPLLPWYQGTANLFKKHQGKTVVAVDFKPLAMDGAAENGGSSKNPFWAESAARVYALVGSSTNDGASPPQQGNVTVVAGEPVDFLKGFTEPIDLLYLDGWPVGTEGYQHRHLAVYEAARPRFHDRAAVLIGDTARDHGGKAALVLPKALEDGFQVLLWGSLTLLARVNPSSVRDAVPRIGPPVPADACLDDAIRLHREGASWEAEQLYRGIVQQWPEHSGAIHLLGVVRHQRGDHAAALRLIGKAIALDPTKAAYFNNYGAALQALGRYVEALTCFHHALRLQAEYVDALSNLGLAQGSLGQDEAALASFRQALKLQPHHLDTIKRLGELLQKQGKEGEAVELYRQVIAERPLPELCLNLGNLLSMSGRTDLAIEQYQKALDAKPAMAEAWFNKGVAHQAERMAPESQNCFRQAVQLCPERPFWRLRQSAVGPLVFGSPEEIDAYRDKLFRTLDSWLASPPPRATWNDLLFSDAFPIFNLAYHGRNNLELKRKIAAVYEPYFRDQPQPTGSDMAARRRIGVVVTRRHEGNFMRTVTGILQKIDGKEFELVLFCAGASVDMLRKKIGRDDIRFVPIPHSLPEAVQRIRSVACDLIYYWEVGSDSLNYLLPFARLAPVQFTSWGLVMTTGIPAIDYFVSSSLVETEAAAAHYSEKLWNSRTMFVNQGRLPPVSPVSRSHFRLPEDRRLYICFQNPLKLHPDADPLFRDILAADPQGLVVLLGGRHERVVRQLKERFEKTIPQAAGRVVLMPMLNFDDYCRLLQMADVVLDPPHYSAASSAYDIFSFNQPIVTLEAEMGIARVTAAYYRKMGIQGLIAASPEEYVRLAVQIANDRDYRMHFRDQLRAASDVIFDDLDTVREYERFFREVLA